MEKTNPKNIVQWLCCDCNRGTLEEIAEASGYKNARRITRPRLEDIAYVNIMCGDVTRERYRIYNDTTGKILVNDCTRKYMIDWILRNCIFNWYDEQEYPITRDSFQHKIRVESLRR